MHTTPHATFQIDARWLRAAFPGAGIDLPDGPPLDWYQREFKSTRVPRATRSIGDGAPMDSIPGGILAHFYMGGEISARGALWRSDLGLYRSPGRRSCIRIDIFVESAVHFMAEIHRCSSIPTGSGSPIQSGCTMETMATEAMLLPAFESLHERYEDLPWSPT